jgi:hypothetical protein
MENDQRDQRDNPGLANDVFEADHWSRTGGPVHRDRLSPEELSRAAMTRAAAPQSHQDASTPASDDKELRRRMDHLTPTELDRLAIIQAGTSLEQGSTYVDLDAPARKPFKALGGETAREGQRLIAKRETDFELWNRLVPSDRGTESTPTIERPAREPQGIENQQQLGD